MGRRNFFPLGLTHRGGRPTGEIKVSARPLSPAAALCPPPPSRDSLLSCLSLWPCLLSSYPSPLPSTLQGYFWVCFSSSCRAAQSEKLSEVGCALSPHRPSSGPRGDTGGIRPHCDLKRTWPRMASLVNQTGSCPTVTMAVRGYAGRGPAQSATEPGIKRQETIVQAEEEENGIPGRGSIRCKSMEVRECHDNQALSSPCLMPLSGCAARHSFIRLFIHQIITKSWVLGPLGWKKTALSLPQRKNSLLGNYRQSSEVLDEGTQALMGIHRHQRSMMEDIWALWDPQGGVWPELGLICQPFFFLHLSVLGPRSSEALIAGKALGSPSLYPSWYKQ